MLLLGRKTFPDEEGTERAMQLISYGSRLRVAKHFPMRRELKGLKSAIRRDTLASRKTFPDEEGTERN